MPWRHCVAHCRCSRGAGFPSGVIDNSIPSLVSPLSSRALAVSKFTSASVPNLRNPVSSSRRPFTKMTTELVPPNPADLMVIRNITPNVVTFSVPFSRFGKIKVGGRGTLGISQLRTHAHTLSLSSCVCSLGMHDLAC